MSDLEHFALLLAVLGLSACAPFDGAGSPSGPQRYESLDGSETIPPLPSFVSLDECEKAYGSGACSTAARVYAQNERYLHAMPADAGSWYIPYAYGSIEPVMARAYFAPPAFYVASRPDRYRLSPAVVYHPRRFDPAVMRQHPITPPGARQWVAPRAPAGHERGPPERRLPPGSTPPGAPRTSGEVRHPGSVQPSKPTATVAPGASAPATLSGSATSPATPPRTVSPSTTKPDCIRVPPGKC